MGERDSKQHLETAGRELELLMGATQLDRGAASGLILVLRVPQWGINRVIMQRCPSSRVISAASTCERLFKAETVFLCCSPSVDFFLQHLT